MTAFHSEANRYEQQAEHYQERIAEFEAKLEPLDRTVAELTDRMASLEQRPLEPWSHQSLISDNFGCCRSELSGLARPAAHGEAVYRRLCRTPLAAVPGRDMFAASVVDTERTKPPAQLREVGPPAAAKSVTERSLFRVVFALLVLGELALISLRHVSALSRFAQLLTP